MTIPVYIGCAPNHEDAESQAVLEYSIRKHTTEDVSITWMKLSRDSSSPFYGWSTSNWPTPFSGFRWAVPALNDFTGRAVYMDSDVIFMADIAELFHMEMTHPIMARSAGRLCVSLWDCGAIEPRVTIDELRSDSNNHSRMTQMYGHGPLVGSFPPGQNWNCLDGETYESLYDSEIKAIHYTSMPHQPQAPHAAERLAKVGRSHWFDGKVTPHWRGDVTDLFDRMLIEAEDAGYRVDNYCLDPIYGDYSKATVSSLQGATPHWGKP